MPIIEQESPLGRVGTLPAEAEQADPTFGETMGAAFRMENTVVSALSQEPGQPGGALLGEQYIDPDFDPFADIEGYEENAEAFKFANTPGEVAAVKRQIDRETRDRETLAAAGPGGFAAAFAAGMIDPTVLIPVGGQIKAGATFGKNVYRAARAGAIGATAAEVALHGSQETRTAAESALAVGGATFLSGLLGGVVPLALRGKIRATAAKVEKDLTPPPDDALDPFEPMGGSVGAKQAVELTIDDETLVSAMGLEKKLGFSSPLLRVLNSPSIEARAALQRMAEVPMMFNKNLEGVATPISAETRIKFWEAPLAESLGEMDRLFTLYRTGRAGGRAKTMAIGARDVVKGPPGRAMRYGEFRAEVGRAMRRGDEHEIPEVAEAARYFRRKVFDPLKQRAIEARLLPEDVDIETATSYLSRVYDVDKINARRPEFRERIVAWLKGQRDQAEKRMETREGDLSVALSRAEKSGDPKAIEKVQARIDEMREKATFARAEDAELATMAEDIIDNILGTPNGRVPYEAINLNRGPLKERVFNIDDELIEDFLLSDIEVVSRFYTRTLAPDVELAHAFGSVEIDAAVTKVNDDYNRQIAAAKTDAKAAALNKQREADLRDLMAMRDRLRGTYGAPANPHSALIRTARGVRTWNYLRILGGVLLSSLTDVARPVMTEGLWRTFRSGIVPLVRNFKTVKLAGDEAKLAGTALDMVLDTRALNLADLGDDFGRYTRFEKGMQSAANMFGLVNLMSPWNAAIKQWTSTIIASRIVDAAKAVKGGTATQAMRAKLAASGIDGFLAEKIAAQFDEFGESVDGLRVVDTRKWTDGEALTAFRAALQKDVDRTIVTPGVGDRPLWMSSELGKVVGQFRSFAFAATQRVLISGLQQKDLATANGAALMFALGMGVYGLKTVVAGREVSDNPGTWVAEGVDRSGLLGWLMDVHNITEKATEGVVGLNSLTGGPQMSRYAVRNAVGALLGPTFGTAEDTFKVTGMAATGELTRSDIRAVRRLLPFQNLFYLRALLNHMEGEVAEEAGVK